MNKIIVATAITLISAHAIAGGPPAAPVEVPIVTELGLMGMSLILAGFAARFVLKRTNKS